MSRLCGIILLLAVWACGQPESDFRGSGRGPKTFVFVHGGWGGGWGFKQVDSLLTRAGHVVYRPTLTGLGERVHLSSASLGLDTHIDDIVNVILYEDLSDLILVGHSYGGMVVTGVADRIPDRIAHLVLVDAFLPEHGESVMSMTGNSITELGKHSPPWRAKDGYLVPLWVETSQAPPKAVPHPIKTLTQPIHLENPAASLIPGTFILTKERWAETDAFSASAQRARARGWVYYELEGDHNPQLSQPGTLVALLLRVAGAVPRIIGPVPGR